MCTMFMKLHKESDMLFAAKTVDTPETVLTFDRKNSISNGYKYLYFKMGWQEGINSGMNEKGLTILSSYASTSKELPIPEINGEDIRGIANESVLSKCSTVQDGLNLMEMVLKEQPSGVGGIHFLLDATGKMAILEHDPIERVLNKKVIESDYAIRSNDPLLLRNRKNLKQKEWEDRNLRYSQVKESMPQIQGEKWLESVKNLLGTHTSEGEKQDGQLCIHHFNNLGSRSKDLTTHTTMTALIFDVKNRQLIYSEGPPCHGQWKVLSIIKRGA